MDQLVSWFSRQSLYIYMVFARHVLVQASEKKLLQMSRLTSVSFPTFCLKQLDLGIPSQLFPKSVITLQIFIIACFLGTNVCWSSAQCLQAGGKWPLGILVFSAHFSFVLLEKSNKPTVWAVLITEALAHVSWAAQVWLFPAAEAASPSLCSRKPQWAKPCRLKMVQISLLDLKEPHTCQWEVLLFD